MHQGAGAEAKESRIYYYLSHALHIHSAIRTMNWVTTNNSRILLPLLLLLLTSFTTKNKIQTRQGRREETRFWQQKHRPCQHHILHFKRQLNFFIFRLHHQEEESRGSFGRIKTMTDCWIEWKGIFSECATGPLSSSLLYFYLCVGLYVLLRLCWSWGLNPISFRRLFYFSDRFCWNCHGGNKIDDWTLYCH